MRSLLVALNASLSANAIALRKEQLVIPFSYRPPCHVRMDLGLFRCIIPVQSLSIRSQLCAYASRLTGTGVLSLVLRPLILEAVQEDITKALRAVHARFFLSRTTVNLALVGPGLVGGALLDQMQNQCCKLQERYKLDVRVLAIASSSKVLLSQSGTQSQCIPGLCLHDHRERLLLHASVCKRSFTQTANPCFIKRFAPTCRRGSFTVERAVQGQGTGRYP
jgi:hypothetical protein